MTGYSFLKLTDSTAWTSFGLKIDGLSMSTDHYFLEANVSTGYPPYEGLMGGGSLKIVHTAIELCN